MSAASDAALAALLADPAVQMVLGLLDRDGEEARVVGGAVRDALLERPVGDVDVATTAVPDEVARRAAAAGLKVVPTGLGHGTLTLLVHGQPVEVTTLRQDLETDGRHAVVAFGRDWAADARRRDFTLNALSLTRDGEVHDDVGGRADLDARRIRFIGDPAARIREDYLRGLRFFRFHAAFGEGGPDQAALAAIVALRDGLSRLSRERVRAELLKLMGAPGAPAMAEVMADAGLLTLLLGGVPRVARLARLAAIETALGLAPDPLRRLGALTLFVDEDVPRLTARLRLANTEMRRLAAMAAAAPRLAPAATEDEARVALYRIGAPAFADRILLAWADANAAPDDPAWRRLLALPERWMPPAFPIGGRVLAAHGVAGPRLGTLLKRLEEEWLAAGFPEDAGWREAAIARAMAP
ncbi:MAG TPA: CCA tRNA nucleotidyltransferase [Hyphomicrobiales bacterium]|nr:CCA tRNA nucleotidyltransferase [Hyphomicrobiales bacterium]